MSLEIINIFLTNDFEAVPDEEIGSTDTDVVVQFSNGDKFIATFFDFNNLNTLQEENLRSGAFLNGRYFWMKNMLLIDDCNLENVKSVVENLISEGDFFDVFKKL